MSFKYYITTLCQKTLVYYKKIYILQWGQVVLAFLHFHQCQDPPKRRDSMFFFFLKMYASVLTSQCIQVTAIQLVKAPICLQTE